MMVFGVWIRLGEVSTVPRKGRVGELSVLFL